MRQLATGPPSASMHSMHSISSAPACIPRCRAAPPVPGLSSEKSVGEEGKVNSDEESGSAQVGRAGAAPGLRHTVPCPPPPACHIRAMES